jgi:hypothetical protein
MNIAQIVAIAGEVVNRRSVLLRNFVVNGQESAYIDKLSTGLIRYCTYTQNDSREPAIWHKDHFKKHIELQNLAILDWGCGPGRIIRHFKVLKND